MVEYTTFLAVAEAFIVSIIAIEKFWRPGLSFKTLEISISQEADEPLGLTMLLFPPFALHARP